MDKNVNLDKFMDKNMKKEFQFKLTECKYLEPNHSQNLPNLHKFTENSNELQNLHKFTGDLQNLHKFTGDLQNSNELIQNSTNSTNSTNSNYSNISNFSTNSNNSINSTNSNKLTKLENLANFDNFGRNLNEIEIDNDIKYSHLKFLKSHIFKSQQYNTNTNTSTNNSMGFSNSNTNTNSNTNVSQGLNSNVIVRLNELKNGLMNFGKNNLTKDKKDIKITSLKELYHTNNTNNKLNNKFVNSEKNLNLEKINAENFPNLEKNINSEKFVKLKNINYENYHLYSQYNTLRGNLPQNTNRENVPLSTSRGNVPPNTSRGNVPQNTYRQNVLHTLNRGNVLLSPKIPNTKAQIPNPKPSYNPVTNSKLRTTNSKPSYNPVTNSKSTIPNSKLPHKSNLHPPNHNSRPNSKPPNPKLLDKLCINVKYWYKPFSMNRLEDLNSFEGLQVLECLVGDVQKSWHLEAIKYLDRSNYSRLKMTMLRLSNSVYNLHPSRLLISCRGNWEIIQEGSFGSVYYGFIEGCGPSAIKIPNPQMLIQDPIGIMKRFINEWDILSRCSHQFIINIYGAIILGLYDIWICTELIHGVDLHTKKYSNTTQHNQIYSNLQNSVVNSMGNLQNSVVNSMGSAMGNLQNSVGSLGNPVGSSTFSTMGNLPNPTLSSMNNSMNIPMEYGLKMCRQLSEVILYLHTPTDTKGIIIHRDIKPENIIIDSNWNIKLCDFGDAFESNSGNINSITGATWLYAPPELLLHPIILNSTNYSGVNSTNYSGMNINSLNTTNYNTLNTTNYDVMNMNNILSEKWDIWSVGCVFQEMFGFPGPFHHLVDMNDSSSIVCEKMVKAAIKGLVPNIPNTLAKTKMGSLILHCLDPNPNNRPTAKEIYQFLQSKDLL